MTSLDKLVTETTAFLGPRCGYDVRRVQLSLQTTLVTMAMATTEPVKSLRELREVFIAIVDAAIKVHQS